MTQVGENHRHKSIAFMDATNMLSRGWQMRLAQIYHKTRVCAYNQRLCKWVLWKQKHEMQKTVTAPFLPTTTDYFAANLEVLLQPLFYLLRASCFMAKLVLFPAR